ncbi:hypothetical protein [Aquihabitans sp. McL0605]|uniref:hypothetical protein n=1 Tax=Aquihabitans sp. McL0605 TaxID=3415671 RepID=UPI003CFA24B9
MFAQQIVNNLPDSPWWEAFIPALLGFVGVIVGGGITYLATTTAADKTFEREEAARAADRRRDLLDLVQTTLLAVVQYETILETLRQVHSREIHDGTAWQPTVEHIAEINLLQIEAMRHAYKLEDAELRGWIRTALKSLTAVVQAPKYEAGRQIRRDEARELVGLVNQRIGCLLTE